MSIAIQEDLFSQVPVHKHDPETSRQAARRAATIVGEMKDEILRLLAVEPLTDDELTDIMQRQHPGHQSYTRTSVGTRRGTLVKEGLVVKTKERRVNERGNPAVVWALNPERVRPL